ncbi:hypothetical protein F5Y13DRAFT_194107 [Hypoxylon sp. FL1857]|nr:hypothetical protein F5Y13DRAFT_194107 [Hypoxylon sp. FL1857]
MSMFRKLRIGHADASEHRRGSQPVKPSEEFQDYESSIKPAPTIPLRSYSEPDSVQALYKSTHSDRKTSTASENTLVLPDTLPSLLLSKQTSRKEYNDPLGLSLVHGTPECEADIILVHGLGGSSWRTWSWERHPDVFWPEWLRHEDGLSHFRVFTYGYNANFMDPENPLSILDFSKALLIRMKTYGDGDVDCIGMKPIVFVAHSMGGLVVKKV